MRFAAYAGASTALATAVILRAFHLRPNFFSASVYLAQSQACRMILLNLVLLCVYSFVRALQKLLYGPLRPIEREQLWDRSWYAITETALAMTTFRDEVGAFFLVMFVTLLAGKVWGWISEGRVEILEQQPPANPRLFHARLSASLLVSALFDIIMLRYCVNTLLDQPRPGMMVMFAFEFAVLLITSTSTTARYSLSLHESFVVKRQTKAKLEERREEIRTARLEAEQQGGDGSSTAIPQEDDVEEHDIDVPGWQEKGRWILFLDLLTDFLKLIVYMLFFTMLLLFHGIPIHILRDVYLTARSFVKRISDFQKYRNATRDMNLRYPDATSQEIERDGTCIICREDMRPWQQQPEPAPGARPNPPLDERQRPKKLPCGHILHLGCLKSWLERQQVCPTCRMSVLAPPPTNNNPTNHFPPHLQPGGPGQQVPMDPHAQNRAGHQPGHANQNGHVQPDVRARTFNIGPWRFTFAAGNANQVRDALHRIRGGQAAQGQPQIQGNNWNLGVADAMRAWRGQQPPINRTAATQLQEALLNMERQVVQDISSLQVAHGQLAQLHALQAELARLRTVQFQLLGQNNGRPGPNSAAQGTASGQAQAQEQPVAAGVGTGNTIAQVPILIRPPQYQQEFLTSGREQQPLGPGHPDLPEGVTLPEGWVLLPLHQTGAYEQDTATSAPESLMNDVEVTTQVSPSASARGDPQASSQNRHGTNMGPDAANASHPNTSALSSRNPGLTSADHATNGPDSAHPSSEATPSIPNWSQARDSGPSLLGTGSNFDAQMGGTRKEEASVNGASDLEQENAASSTNGNVDKGKGRAATVEDVDDVD